MSDYPDYHDEEPDPILRRRVCIDCDRDYMDEDPDRNKCPGCRALGGAPGACLVDGCKGGRDMHWSEDEYIAECPECDSRFTVETLRTFTLGQLVEQVVAETKTGSAEEVGRLILARGRAILRRVS